MLHRATSAQGLGADSLPDVSTARTDVEVGGVSIRAPNECEGPAPPPGVSAAYTPVGDDRAVHPITGQLRLDHPLPGHQQHPARRAARRPGSGRGGGVKRTNRKVSTTGALRLPALSTATSR